MRQRKAPVTLTQAAIEQLNSLMSSAPEGTLGMRFGLKNSGCAGMAYVLHYTDKKEMLDECLSLGDYDLIIDQKAVLFLLGTQIDYVDDLMESGFRFRNPNQVDACGCGESVKLKEASVDVDLSSISNG
jgi:iron-sulfur cluster assembly protein